MAGGNEKKVVTSADAYSEPGSSKNRTEKALKPKFNITKKSMQSSFTKMKTLQATLQVQGKKKKNKRKKIVSEGIRGDSEKKDEKKLISVKVQQKSIASEEHNGQSRQIHETKEKLGGSQKKQKNQKYNEVSRGLDLENRKNPMNKEKHVDLENNQQKEKKKEKLGGLIFMCNAKTKPDCFRYRVMGVSISKKELVLGVKPGLKLFLYDFDLKLMYGIYKASSSGGVKLEPAAFNGGFPVQVRFIVHQDCYPVPESVFRKAIKENYNERNKFDTELSVKQVKKLEELFRPAEVLPKAPTIGPQPIVAIQSWEPYTRDPHNYEEVTRNLVLPRENDQNLPNREVPSRERQEFGQHTFLSEKEYRTYGLRGEIPNPRPTSYIAPVVEPYPSGHVTDHLRRHPHERDIAALQGEPIRQDRLLLTEREYQTYGISARRESQHSIPTVTATAGSTLDSYPSHLHYSSHYGSSTLDPYQPPTRRVEVPSGSYYHSGTELRETYPIETDRLQRRGAYPTETETDHLGRRASYLTEFDSLRRRENDDMERIYSTYASNALSDYNRTNNYQEARSESSLAPVSSRYSFAGPYTLYR